MLFTTEDTEGSLNPRAHDIAGAEFRLMHLSFNNNFEELRSAPNRLCNR
jgi:hypothetical protein